MNEEKFILSFSKRLIKAQGPIRILESVRWTDDVRERFRQDRGKELPRVDSSWYDSRRLDLNVNETTKEFFNLEKGIRKSLGTDHPAAAILLNMCHEYRSAVRMIDKRGQPEFAELSSQLYGSTKDRLHPGEPTLFEFGKRIAAALDRIEPCMHADDPDDVADIPGKKAAVILQKRLTTSMSCHGEHPTVIADDGITADAAAGADKIKLREDAFFSKRELRLLEVHEGWVHVGTTLNGRSQPVCQFLSKGTPSATITQEGLAVLMEIVAFASSPCRQRRINNRILAVGMAEDGANFLEVYRFFLDQNFSETDSYQFATRVFRGSTPEGKPFTKDIAYTRGFVLLYNFLRAAINAGKLDLIPLIFCGKTVLKEVGNLQQLREMKLLSSPSFIPPQFADLHGLAAWMCYDGVLSSFGCDSLQSSFMDSFT